MDFFDGMTASNRNFAKNMPKWNVKIEVEIFIEKSNKNNPAGNRIAI